MSISRKYGRTFHFPFSPGTTSDDRINFNYWEDLKNIKNLVHTEKLDGENTCISQYGVFARSHALPTRNPWANFLKEKWSWLKNDLGDLEIFGENLYAIHSIEYKSLENHFFVFGIREKEEWLSWEETKFYAQLFEFETVPELKCDFFNKKEEFETNYQQLTKQVSFFDSFDAHLNTTCQMEGIVSRNSENYAVDAFKSNIFKFVRKNHVKTDQHWRRNWKRAPLKWERNTSCGN